MNDEASRYQKEPEIAHIDGARIGAAMPEVGIPGHAPEPPMVMPIEQVNAQLSKGSIAGNLAHMLGGVTETTKKLCGIEGPEPRMVVHPTLDERWMP